jgi:hypothetical protein
MLTFLQPTQLDLFNTQYDVQYFKKENISP